MKKIFVFFLIFIIFSCCNVYVMSKKNTIINTKKEIRGVYISYLEYLHHFQNNSLSMNKVYIKKMLDQIHNSGFNTIFLHVSPFSDAIYNSKIFPYSYTLTGIEGKNPGMDYLDYFIKEGHKRNIQVHAWINPYRILNSNDISKLSKNNPAYVLLNNNDVQITENGLYYNPASSKVLELLISQVKEIILNYNIDGIHFDDYFYPNETIDLQNYQEYSLKESVSLKDYRLKIINNMVKKVYQTIKELNSNIIFSIAPDGNIENNYEIHYADIKTWLEDDGYIDMIMPQIYYGFENEYKPFKNTIQEWESLIHNEVLFIPVLAFYKVGEEDSYAGFGKFEWIEHHDIISKEVLFLKDLSKYQGFSLFRYDYIYNVQNEYSKEELRNLKEILN